MTLGMCSKEWVSQQPQNVIRQFRPGHIVIDKTISWMTPIGVGEMLILRMKGSTQAAKRGKDLFIGRALSQKIQPYLPDRNFR